MTSPDYQIVAFQFQGVSYKYTGSSKIVEIVSGDELIPIKDELNARLKRSITHHVPADEQITRAFIDAGFRASQIPEIIYTEDQPEGKLPEGAVS
jgi:hypothetical protein